MRILQICNKVPFPPKDGGCIAMNNLTIGLREQGHEVKVLAINTPKHFTDVAKSDIEAVLIDTSVKVFPALLNLLSSKSYNVVRFYSKAFEQKLIEILKSNKFDIVQLESVYVSMYIDVIRKNSNAKIILRAHNVEHQIWERAAELPANPLKKWYLKLLSKRLYSYEISLLNKVDAVIPITERDANWFKSAGFKKEIKVAPFGITLQTIISEKGIEENPASLFHIGAMDWHPNVEGVNWFLNDVWEKVMAANPNTKLFLAGRNMSEEMKSLNKKNVTVVGQVENAHDFMKSHGIMIVPLLTGGGMRVKIIEGMALGKTIVTTSIGAEGIEARNTEEIMIADTANDFANAITELLVNIENCQRIGKNAERLAKEKYNNSDICKQLSNFYSELKAK